MSCTAKNILKKLLFLLGVLFTFVGSVLLRSVNVPVEQPLLLEQAGVVSKVESYRTSKFGEVFYFELEGVKTRFWLKARMEKEPGMKEKLLADIQVGDRLTAYYTSLEGTSYDYLSAPYSVSRVEKNGVVIDGLTFVGGKGVSTFTKGVFYLIGGIILLVGVGMLTTLAWLWVASKHTNQ